MNQKQLKAKEQIFGYGQRFTEKDIGIDLFGAVGLKGQINNKMDKEFLKAFNGEEAEIRGNEKMDDVLMRLVTVYNIHIYNIPSYVEEVAHNNAGKGIAKIYPLSSTESVVIAKRTNKKHGIKQGMILFRAKMGFNSTYIIPEMRAFKQREFDNIFEELQNQGVEMYKVMGDKFLVEQ